MRASRQVRAGDKVWDQESCGGCAQHFIFVMRYHTINRITLAYLFHILLSFNVFTCYEEVYALTNKSTNFSTGSLDSEVAAETVSKILRECQLRSVRHANKRTCFGEPRRSGAKCAS